MTLEQTALVWMNRRELCGRYVLPETIEVMYERDISDTEIIIARLNSLIDLAQETLDVLQMILQNQNQAYLIAGIAKSTSKEMCGRIECGHWIDVHQLFGGCQVSECECRQFYRKEKDA